MPPDDLTYSGLGATVPSNTKQVTDEHITRGHMPVVKIAVSADGDAALVPATASGLKVDLGADNDVTVTGSVTANAGTNLNTSALALEATQADVKTAVQLLDDTVKTDDAAFTPAVDKVLMVGAQLDNTLPDSVDEGDAGALRMSANRSLHVQLRDAAGNERGLNVDASGNIGVTDAGASLTIDGTVTANAGTGTFTVGDGGASLTVDNANLDNLHSSDFDTGVGTDTTPAIGIALPGSGGAVVGGTATNPLRTDPTGTTAQPVTGSVTANAGTNLNTSALSLEATQADVRTALQLIDDIVRAEDEASGDGHKGAVVLAVRKATPANTSGLDGDYETLQVSAGRLWASATIDAALPAGTNNIGDVDIATMPNVTLAAGTNTNEIVGDVADDAAVAGNPVRVGAVAKEQDGTDPGSVSAEDDLAGLIADRNRRLYVNTAHPNLWSVFEDHTAAQTNNQLKAAPGAGLSLYITDIVYSNGATAGSIKLVEDESVTPTQITQTLYMAVNGGAVINFKTPKKLTANKSLGFTSTTVTTHSLEVHGYIAP